MSTSTTINNKQIRVSSCVIDKSNSQAEANFEVPTKLQCFKDKNQKQKKRKRKFLKTN